MRFRWSSYTEREWERSTSSLQRLSRPLTLCTCHSTTKLNGLRHVFSYSFRERSSQLLRFAEFPEYLPIFIRDAWFHSGKHRKRRGSFRLSFNKLLVCLPASSIRPVPLPASSSSSSSSSTFVAISIMTTHANRDGGVASCKKEEEDRVDKKQISNFTMRVLPCR